MSVETAESKALALINAFTSGTSFDVPEVDLSGDVFKLPGGVEIELYTPVERLSIEQLTDGTTSGEGVFDVLMKGCGLHLRQEYEAGRITGSEYSKTYIAMMEAAMANATQFVLARDQAFWEAQKSQIAAITGRAELEKAKLDVALVGIQAATAKAEYGKSVMSLALAQVEHDKAEYELDFVLPKQLEKLTAENILLATENDKALVDIQLTEAQVLKVEAETLNEPKQGVLLDKQALRVDSDIEMVVAQRALVVAQTANEPKQGNLLDKQGLKIDADILMVGSQRVLVEAQAANEPKQGVVLDKQAIKIDEDTVMVRAQTALTCTQKANVEAQTLNEPKKGKLLDEQVEATRAQTLDTRLDGATVVGTVGKQKELYSQQITAYQRDSEVKAARIFTDAWITQKTIDEGLTAPTGFTNASIDQVLTSLKSNNGLTGTITPSAPPIM